jgi:hypothetical protein
MRFSFIALWVAVAAGGSVAAGNPSAPQLFALYQQGRYDELTVALAAVTDFHAFRKDVASAVEKARLEAAAGFILEVAHAAFSASRLPMTDQEARDILEDGCRLVRRLPSGSEFDRRWQLASLALLDADGFTGHGDVKVPLDFHLGHLRGRIDPGVAALSRAFSAEQRFGAFQSNPLADVSGPLKSIGDRALADSVRGMTAARKFDTVSAEATVHLGYLLIAQQQPDAAVALLAVADGITSDVKLRYLVHLFLGRAHEAAGRRAEAAAEYRRALTFVRGQSAAIALSALEFLSGNVAEATRLANGVASGSSAPTDPWMLYFSGGYMDWPGRLSRVREMAR